MFPVRGQVALVRNSLNTADGKIPAGSSVSGTDDGSEESCYGMTCAAGGGTVLGGCSQVGNWDEDVDSELGGRILRRAGGVVPGLFGGDGEEREWDVIRHGVGSRPARESGVRVESERVILSAGGGAEEHEAWVVHNCGHAGEGYQISIGCAEKAVELVEAIFMERDGKK
ncbi:hypothetical protein ONS95_000047 [Cadophora gregata]|uniref:uncharacterized protein n=1 Tax=Cadophora gregata TaxID=51156 RepID=UPI0026DA9086|nr:uncharacterized protein ONS95_000047 [Cadophora gregata]KAK0115685.1 hypothetical protein ONS96_014131 [Cadophora gregata f. sp. sojae]KAK0128063.1 hypothetical protein ONS95_000047 [Cadophora gregata]